MPLQSLSLPSHSSVVGSILPTQLIVPLMHLLSPCRHSPMPMPHLGLDTLPCASTSGLLSSMVPLQSLSLLSHSSGAGFFVQPSLPFVHVVTPPAHSPTWFAHGLP